MLIRDVMLIWRTVGNARLEGLVDDLHMSECTVCKKCERAK